MNSNNCEKKTENSVKDAVAMLGGQQSAAEQMGVSQQFISHCVRRGWVPLRRAVEMEQLTGVPRVKLINPRIADLVDLPGV